MAENIKFNQSYYVPDAVVGTSLHYPNNPPRYLLSSPWSMDEESEALRG